MSNITSAEFCFSAHRARSINDQINVPFYIFAPDFRDSSGGIRVLHYLCHILNEMGEEAYLINTGTASPRLRTPKLTLQKLKQHFLSGRNPVTIYPEVVSHNPANTPLIARWLLNIPGHLGKTIEFEPDDLLFYYEAWCLPKGLHGSPLFIHPVDHNYFNNDNNQDDNNRTLECFYANKYHLGNKPILKEHENLISLGQEIKRTHEEIAKILRQSKVLYCYEPSGIISEAQACGCPVILIRSDYWPLPPDDTHHKIMGLAIYGEENYLAQAQKTLPQIQSIHAKARDNSWTMTKSMVHEIYQAQEHLLGNGKTCHNAVQELWALDLDGRKRNIQKFTDLYLDSEINFENIDYLTSLNTSYANHQKWLENRAAITPEEIARLDHKALAADGSEISFNLFIRLTPGSELLLADTLDSLGQQILTSWHLDVVTTLPAPAGIADATCVGWHVLAAMEESKATIDLLVNQRNHPWNIEIPAGAWLDPLYLWRLAKESQASPDTVAFFVDDDCHDEKGIRFNLRLKPGVNPSSMLASDLAGPLCVNRNAWRDAEGASSRNGSPWFSQLLRITDTFGWSSIKHTPDVLISYLEKFPSDIESCLIGLVENQMHKGIDSEVIPVTGQSWNIRYPLLPVPTITIAIISQGQLDFLPRCFDSIIEKTQYPDYEIIIALTASDEDPDLSDWLETIQQSSSPRIHTVRTSAAANHATRCNAAAQESSSDFVLLVREEAVIIQDKWLEDLVRTCLQPDIAAAAPCLIAPGTSLIQEAGSVLGLGGIVGSPYRGEAKLGDLGYLDALRIARDTSALSGACLLVRKADYLSVGGMDETSFGDHYADTDICQKLRALGKRLIYQPQSTVVYGSPTSLEIGCNIDRGTQNLLNESHAKQVFSKHWLLHEATDPFWNPNLSLATLTPTPETGYQAQWQYLPTAAPRILSRHLTNGQGTFRITAPLSALRKAGMATECLWAQENDNREPSASEILRLAPDTAIVQHYITDEKLSGLESWQALPNRPLIVYSIDDLLTNMAETNPFRKRIPANSRARLKYALTRCDRMVVSTEYLAHEYRHLISDIRIVPNRLEQELWLPLRSRKRTGKKPRIGWAGGTTHQGDLILLKETIEQTHHEADWIFFGMCPDEILPFVSEYHAIGSFAEYPARLAALNLDIAVAPLEQIPFNRGKSNLRLLEYGILGIPVVCTDIDPYQDSPACRVANTVEAWTKALRERIYDADAREREGLTLRQWVHQGYLLENHLDEWLRAHIPD